MSTIPTEEMLYEVEEDGFTVEITDAPLSITVTEDAQLFIANVDE